MESPARIAGRAARLSTYTAIYRRYSLRMPSRFLMQRPSAPVIATPARRRYVTAVQEIRSVGKGQPDELSSSVEIIRKPHLKHITIRVTHAGIVKISAPAGASKRRIDEIIETKRRWIEKHLAEARRKTPYTDVRIRVMLDGVWLETAIRHARDNSGSFNAIPEENRCVIECPDDSGEGQRAIVRRWFISRARNKLPEAAYSLAKDKNLRIEKVYVRNQKSRWGSSSSRGNLSLNWRLIMVPPDVRRYLILHEIAHQRHMNHSSAFWTLIGLWCNEYRRHDTWLKEHAYLLSVLRLKRRKGDLSISDDVIRARCP